MAKPKLTDADWERIWQEKFAREDERFDLTPKSSLGSPLRSLSNHMDKQDLDKIHDYKFKYATSGYVLTAFKMKP